VILRHLGTHAGPSEQCQGASRWWLGIEGAIMPDTSPQAWCPSRPNGEDFVALANEELGTQSCSVHENILNPNAVVPWHQHAVEEIIVCLSALVNALSRAPHRAIPGAASW